MELSPDVKNDLHGDGMAALNGRNLKADAEAIFRAGLQAVDPEVCVRRHLRLDGNRLVVGETAYALDRIGKIVVVGVGKASTTMARAAEAVLGERIAKGLVITKYGHGVPLAHCQVLEAAHPVPDENGVTATRALLDRVAGTGPDDLVLCLISGGGSALSPAPAAGIRLADKQATTRLLLACGATIHEINTVRKHLSRIKGGQLCRRANGAAVAALILSDVIGDNLDIIASGSTAPDPGTFGDCRAILDRYGLWDRIPGPVKTRLEAGCNGKIPETPKPGDPIFARVHNQIVGNISAALGAAEKVARSQGFTPLVLASTIQGEASEVARVLCAIAREVTLSGHPVAPPACLLAGGETTVTLKGTGLGGRNTELALAAAMELDGARSTLLLSAGTDGTDGPTDAAGAFADGSTLRRAKALGLKPAACLADNDSYHCFASLGDLLITGPTRTNVMDLQIVLITA
ncbi:glycerate kinase type-2 family protein [Desulfosarcina ovata]|nr:glycerate kinase [Desulfosarcina ovata]